jgi:hypothetical protein
VSVLATHWQCCKHPAVHDRLIHKAADTLLFRVHESVALSENLITSACSSHMQAEQRYALHNGQDTADTSAAQSTPAVASTFSIKMMNLGGGNITVQVHGGMTVFELKEIYEVCSYACQDAMRMHM